MHFIKAYILLFLFCPFLTADAQIRFDDRYSDIPVTLTHYELSLSFDFEDELLFGEAILTLENHTDRDIEIIPLKMYRLLEVSEIKNNLGDPIEFNQEVVSYSDLFRKQVNFIEILPDQALKAGEERVIKIIYSGTLAGYTEVGYFYIKDNIKPDFTLIRDDAEAFPTPGIPNRKVEISSPMPEYSYQVNITIPDSLTVANGGRLLDLIKQGEEVTYIYESYVPSWRMDFAIAPYSMFETDNLRVFYFRKDLVGAAGVMKAAEASLNLYRNWMGPLKSNIPLTFIEIKDGWGSQKDATTIIQSAAAFKDPKRHREVYHEVSHLWNVRDKDLPSPRWNEGFASFMEYLTIEKLENREIVDDRAELLINWLNSVVENRPEWKTTSMLEYGNKGMTDLSYSVGALMFDQLYRIMGSKAFMGAMGSFYNDYFSSGASTEELVNHLKEQSSHDLTAFFDDWVYTAQWHKRIAENPDPQKLYERYMASADN